jgi:ComF family protein
MILINRTPALAPIMKSALLQPWLDAALGLLYPAVCQLCGQMRATADDGYVCEVCRDSVRVIQRPFCERCGLPYEAEITGAFQCPNCLELELHFSSARSAVLARGATLEAIHRYKYRGGLWFEAFLGELLCKAAVPDLAHENWDMIVPVPLHHTRFRERGFNQAERMAECLSSATAIPVRRNALVRTKPTPTQTRLDRSQRAENVRRSFAMRELQNVDNCRIVLVDDVFTTGATTSACAKVLRAAGAADVCVWTVARGF